MSMKRIDDFCMMRNCEYQIDMIVVVSVGLVESSWQEGDSMRFIVANLIALTSTNNKGIILNPLYGVFSAVHRITLPRGLLCKSLHAKWRCSDV